MYFRDTGFIPQDPSNRGYLKKSEWIIALPQTQQYAYWVLGRW